MCVCVCVCVYVLSDSVHVLGVVETDSNPIGVVVLFQVICDLALPNN